MVWEVRFMWCQEQAKITPGCMAPRKIPPKSQKYFPSDNWSHLKVVSLNFTLTGTALRALGFIISIARQPLFNLRNLNRHMTSSSKLGNLYAPTSRFLYRVDDDTEKIRSIITCFLYRGQMNQYRSVGVRTLATRFAIKFWNISTTSWSSFWRRDASRRRERKFDFFKHS